MPIFVLRSGVNVSEEKGRNQLDKGSVCVKQGIEEVQSPP